MLEWLALATAVASGVPIKAKPVGNPASWVQASDLPRSADEAAVTTFDLTIDRSGRPILCTVIIASGSERLDSAVCAALMKRARFKPAEDQTGSPMPAVYRDRVVWLPNGFGQNRWYKDPDIVVSAPTITEKQTDLVAVVVMMDVAGTVDECFIAESAHIPTLDKLACAAVRNPEVSQPIKDAQGTPLRGIRSFYVGFAPSSQTSVELR